ncbi:type VI secretion system-associated protein TagF [Pseudophaeobacter sp.]|uniref:type VI secretion system-associated protein TagF n=1 Tax=Pseudophaeobacter sp. TaxID=1971739 RepID=UPI003296A7A1
MGGGFGAFGKMADVGDFFRLSAPGGFVRVWDSWLQQLMIEGQAHYGTGFDSHYMSAPIWRFTLAAGQAGPSKIMGVLMPSVDRVGRRFPLTLMVQLDTPGPPALDHLRERPLFERLEDVALSTLEDGMSRDRLAAALRTLEVPDLRASVPLRQDGSTFVLTGSGGEGSLVETHLAGALLAKQVPGGCLWSSYLESGPRMMISSDLPLGRAGCGLFDLAAPIWREAQPI